MDIRKTLRKFRALLARLAAFLSERESPQYTALRLTASGIRLSRPGCDGRD